MGRVLDSYAYARVVYHRGLDALRRSGWRGQARCRGSTSRTGETEEAERQRLAGEVGAALLERLGLATEVRVLPGGTIPRVELGKAVRVVQRTAGHDPLPGWLF